MSRTSLGLSLVAVVVGLLVSAGCGQVDQTDQPDVDDQADQIAPYRADVLPHGQHHVFGVGPEGSRAGLELAVSPGPTSIASVTSGYGITYHGGPVMRNPVHAYYIWYGNWANNTAKTILTDLVSNLGGSPYYGINTTYGDSSGASVPNAITYAGAENDNYSQGTRLSDAQVRTIVASHVGAGHFPVDPDGIYFVLTSADVNERSGFCTQYCGWHTNGTIAGADLKYVFAGNPDRCPSSCEEQTIGPNGNAGADGMASIISHELEEASSDPDLNAWYDSSGEENADKCAWTFGATYTTANGASANMKLGARDFLIQQNWANLPPSGGCLLSYVPTPDFTIGVSPSSQTMYQNGSASFTVTVTGVNGFSGAVDLSVSGLGAGMTGTLSVVSVPAGGTSTLTVTTSIDALIGSYPLTITGTSAALVHSAPATVVVIGPPDFTIAASPVTSTVAQGASTSYLVTVSPVNGFSGPVTLTASGFGAGTSGSFNPAIVNGSGVSTLTVTATSSAALVTSTIAITATSGALVHAASVDVTVSPPSTDRVVNGTFETGALAPWTIAGSAAVVATPHTGAFAARVGATTPTFNSSISQTFMVPISGGTISFWYLVVCPDVVQYDWATVTIRDNTTGQPTTVLPKTCTNNNTWVHVQRSLPASAGHSVTLTLSNRDDNYPGDATYTLYDDVHLQ